MTNQQLQNEHLDWLEAESIYIIREVAAQCANPALLFSGGKDSIVMFHLARKAFSFGDRPIQLTFPLLHVAIEEHKFDALLGGARRDEEKARAKERIFSFRDEFGQWDPKAQRPELWKLYNARISPGENMRVFPISNWTELDIWQYIAREKLELPSIYYTHKREVVKKNGLLVPVTDITPKAAEDVSEFVDVRFRTVGDISCTCPVASVAATPEAIIAETAITEITERGATRMDDQTSEASMERRKKEGYF